MQQTIAHLSGSNIGATDGELGKVEDFYFDDATWTVRYFIVKTGSWMFGRKVLISPHALLPLRDPGIFPVSLTMEQVRLSPDIDTEKPVSRQQEEHLAKYYPWTSYWGPGFYPGSVREMMHSSHRLTKGISWKTDDPFHQDQHLRSTKMVTGYHIHASDDDIGHVNDFVVDDQTWEISHIVVDTHNWFGGKKVLIAVEHIREVQWENAKVVIDLTVDAVKTSVEVDEQAYIMK